MRTEFDRQQLRARRRRTGLAAAIIFLLIPLTIGAGVVLFDGQRYLLISLLIVFYTCLPFFLVYEKRRPKAREIVLIAMMAALTVCGNLLGYLAGPLQPGTALVMVAGIALGPEAGFLTGALARLCANLFAMQGPWTPWQMFSWGLLGFLAGVAFNRAAVNRVNSRRFALVPGPVVCTLLAVAAALGTHLLRAGFPPVGGTRVVLAVAGAAVAGALALGLWQWRRRGERRPLLANLLCLGLAVPLSLLADRLDGGASFLGWRLYAFGALGLVCGLVVQRQRLPLDGFTLASFGFLSTFILYGGVMNAAALVMASAIPAAQMGLSWPSLRLLYLSGVPYDALHGAGTALFLFLCGPALIQKLERVKVKYGFYR